MNLPNRQQFNVPHGFFANRPTRQRPTLTSCTFRAALYSRANSPSYHRGPFFTSPGRRDGPAPNAHHTGAAIPAYAVGFTVALIERHTSAHANLMDGMLESAYTESTPPPNGPDGSNDKLAREREGLSPRFQRKSALG